MVCRADNKQRKKTMKKLMVLLVAGVLAIGANAASINWTATKGYLYDGGDSTKVTSGTAYLVLASYSQGDLVSAFAAANGDAATTLASITTLGTGAIGGLGANHLTEFVNSAWTEEHMLCSCKTNALCTEFCSTLCICWRISVCSDAECFILVCKFHDTSEVAAVWICRNSLDCDVIDVACGAVE